MTKKRYNACYSVTSMILYFDDNNLLR